MRNKQLDTPAVPNYIFETMDNLWGISSGGQNMRKRSISAITLGNRNTCMWTWSWRQTSEWGCQNKQTNFNHSDRTPAAFHHSCLFTLGGAFSQSPSEVRPLYVHSTIGSAASPSIGHSSNGTLQVCLLLSAFSLCRQTSGPCFQCQLLTHHRSHHSSLLFSYQWMFNSEPTAGKTVTAKARSTTSMTF